jgi:hypothetical protein
MPTQEDWQNNPFQFNLLDYTTATPEGDTQAVGYTPRYLTDMLQRQDLVEQGKATPWERQLQQMQVQAAQQVPMRDPATLQYDAGEQSPTTLSGGSPDLARLMLGLRQKLQQGMATDQERDLYTTTYRQLAEQTYRSVVPQASDAFSPLGDQFFSALGVLGLGATGGLAAAPLFAGGAGLATTLGSLGTLSGVAGTGAGVLGQATEQDWLQKLGMGLGAAGGIAGGLGGLANLWSSGVQSLGDAARLASNAGRVVGGVGAIADNDIVRQAGGWLGTAGQLGGGVDTLSDVFGGGVKDLTDAARLASGLGNVTGAVGRVTGNRPLQQASGLLGLGGRLGGNVQGLLGAANQAQQRGMQTPVPRTMSDQDWLRWQAQPGPLQANAAPVLWNL